MKLKELINLLSGGDLRSLGKAGEVLKEIKTQSDFDQLLPLLEHSDPVVVMRASDIIEKFSASRPAYLQKHKIRLIELMNTASQKELKWHLSLILPRLELNENESGQIWEQLRSWATDRSEGRIVRVNALEGLFSMLQKLPELSQDFFEICDKCLKENIPSLNARINILLKTQRNMSPYK